MKPAAALLLGLSCAACGQQEERGAVAAEGAEDAAESCIDCHRRRHPGIVADDAVSPHRKIPLDCDDCHGTDHDEIFARRGAVPPTVCARCHEEAYTAFRRSHHGRRLKSGKLDALLDPALPATGGCTATGGCHSIQKVYDDGSVGRCGSCHITHAFRSREARNPRVCTHCHEGTDGPQYRAWLRSAHSMPSPTGAGPIAGCVTCHGTHDVSDAVTHGLPPHLKAKPVRSLPSADRAEFDAGRAVMLKRCNQCHSLGFARRALEQADLWRNHGALLLERGQAIIKGLARDGLLDPPPAGRPRNPVAGHALRLGGAQVFDESASLPERLYYEMHFKHYPGFWRAVYHNDPERVAWEANDALKSTLDRLRAIQRDLRRNRKAKGDQ